MLTRVTSGLYGGGLAGSFAGKTSSGASSHPVGTLTRVESGLYGGRRAGSFAGKAVTGGGAHPVGELTRVTSGLWGGRLAGSFALKIQSTVSSGNVIPKRRRLKRVWFDLPISEIKETEEISRIEEVKEVIKSVALRQSQDTHLDEQQKLEELERELLLIGIEFEGWYLDILNAMRRQFINEEMVALIRKNVQSQDMDIVFILSALAAERII